MTQMTMSCDAKTGGIRRVTTYVDSRGVLDDLDVRASDLLQSNGIVWLEGPSDRLYFNRWIHLLTNGALVEGAHYQCVFYGGRLLAHLSGEAPFDTGTRDQAVNIFSVNRNAILLIDSDRRAEGDPLNDTKTRMIASVKAQQGHPWVTSGREIENYISVPALRRAGLQIDAFGQFESLADALDRSAPGAGSKFLRQKPVFAEKITELLTRDDLLASLDLAPRLLEASATIAAWSGVKVAWKL